MKKTYLKKLCDCGGKMVKEVAIDNDFVNHLVEIDYEQDALEKLLLNYFGELSYLPIMHELVFQHEVINGADTNNKIRVIACFEKGIFDRKRLDTFLYTSDRRDYYISVFEELYRDFKGLLPMPKDSILNSWHSNCSFGEVHTISMCCLLECDVFLSDDSDSKRLATILEDKFAFSINVYNRSDTVEEIKRIGTSLNKFERKLIKHKAK